MLITKFCIRVIAQNIKSNIKICVSPNNINCSKHTRLFFKLPYPSTYLWPKWVFQEALQARRPADPWLPSSSGNNWWRSAISSPWQWPSTPKYSRLLCPIPGPTRASPTNCSIRQCPIVSRSRSRPLDRCRSIHPILTRCRARCCRSPPTAKDPGNSCRSRPREDPRDRSSSSTSRSSLNKTADLGIACLYWVLSGEIEGICVNVAASTSWIGFGWVSPLDHALEWSFWRDFCFSLI